MAKKGDKKNSDSKKPKKSLIDLMTYTYIRRIKKWMFCPACQNGKMAINRSSTLWQCEDCGYRLSADEFEDDYVFWFCDECEEKVLQSADFFFLFAETSSQTIHAFRSWILITEYKRFNHPIL